MNSFFLIAKFVLRTFPAVKRELRHWQDKAVKAGDAELAAQALASIKHKRFHCLGGCIYSLYPGINGTRLLRLIVALQTISDYLDNLCDRAGVLEERAFRQLHLAMTDALSPENTPADYYKFYPHKDDGGYLAALVTACQAEIRLLPCYQLVRPHVLKLASLYSELQTYKHIDWSLRERRMLDWTATHLPDYPGIGPWEFAAATGSTLGIFMLCAAASKPKLSAKEAHDTLTAYFPWICGLHILLDYFIDRSEDLAGGDLNFVAYYPTTQQTLSRLTLFWTQALAQAETLPQSPFHRTVIQGLFAMYLSDAKTDNLPERCVRDALLTVSGPYTRLLYRLCRLLRSREIL